MKNKAQPPTFESLTMIHGLRKLSSKERSHLLWRFIMVVNCIITIAYLVIVSNRYRNGVIITRINSNCRINQVPFPAVSICNYNLVSHKRSRIIQNILKSSNISESDVALFLQSLPNLVDYRNSNGRSTNFAHILDVLQKHYFTIDEIMEEVHQKCEDLLLYCSFNRKQKNCIDMFKMVKTFEGHCCTFNYVALNDLTEEVLLDEDGDVEYYKDTETDNKHPGIVISSESGRGSGLLVLFTVEPSDYPLWSLTSSFGAKVLIFDPNDYPEYSMIYKQINMDVSLDIKVQPYVFQAEDSLRSLPDSHRGCVFHDEVELKHTDRYSTEVCATECKMRSFLKYCGCVPYKYPREAASRICDFKDLGCLSNFRANKMSGERCDPVCYLECRDKRYRITSDVMPLLPDFFPDDIMSKQNASELSALQVFFDKPTCTCYKQMLLMDVTSFIATYGGIFSLSFGASLLTLFEIVYITLNSVIYCLRNSCSKWTVE